MEMHVPGPDGTAKFPRSAGFLCVISEGWTFFSPLVTSAPLLISAKTAAGPTSEEEATGGGGPGGGGGGGGGGAGAAALLDGPPILKSATDPPYVKVIRPVICPGGPTDLGVPRKTSLVMFCCIFCEFINQTEEGPDPFDVFRVSRLQVGLEALRQEISRLTCLCNP